jgi:hypothetical protein
MGKAAKGRRHPREPGDRVTWVTVDLEALEMARGYDGFLRGKPEPVVLVAVFLVAPAGTRLLARSLQRFHPASHMPCVALPDTGRLLNVRTGAGAATSLLVLGVALEEDGGGDISRLYAVLERPADLHLRVLDAPLPQALEEHAAHAWAAPPARVDVLVGGVDAGRSCASDKWVGAAVLVVPSATRATVEGRLHFTHGEGQNDWTARLTVRL